MDESRVQLSYSEKIDKLLADGLLKPADAASLRGLEGKFASEEEFHEFLRCLDLSRANYLDYDYMDLTNATVVEQWRVCRDRQYLAALGMPDLYSAYFGDSSAEDEVASYPVQRLTNAQLRERGIMR
jgi:hypothetical protein